MTYAEMKAKVFAHATLKDGFSGDTVEAGIAVHDGMAYIVYPCGYVQFREAQSQHQAVQMVRNSYNHQDTFKITA